MVSSNPTVGADEFVRQEYDFVICGGGTAGLVLAARLTENPDVTVGVIEAGEYLVGDPLVDTPGFFFRMFHDEKYDWVIKTMPQKGNKDVVHHMPRGKLLGGSSGINYLMYVRGSKQDYDDWAELLDDESWGSKELNKYFAKHETMDPIPENTTDRSTFPFVADYHGTSGPIHTSFNEEKTGLEGAVCTALKEAAGFPADHMPVDPWSGDHIGFYNTLGTVSRTGPNRGKRSYAARGYFEPNKHRSNLKVICNALVHRIILDAENSTATGVSFSHGDTMYQVGAKREVVVCAGAVKTPQILELSGIGNPEVLQAAGVHCKVQNRGVGANFQDHMWTPLVYQLKPETYASNDSLHRSEVMAQAMKTLEEHQSGPLTSIASLQGFLPFQQLASPDELEEAAKSIEQTEASTEFERRQLQQVAKHLRSDISANLQLILIPVTGSFHAGIRNQSVLFPPPGVGAPDGFTLAVVHQYPASRGTVHITSPDPSCQPAVDPAYNKHPADGAVLAAGLKFSEEAMEKGDIGRHIERRILPTPEVELGDLAQGLEAVEDVVLGAYHACGSCAMGDALDARLRVRGVEGLRVCDASVFPNNVSGNIVGTVYAVAEKGADIIKSAHGI
ncbi:aryl-alcohol dehydrogenase [Xylariomycetidae sp. FL0641]|nr:aryl-alcohol dehydrogenase [Xylariomycetidae sp. FL0641]